MTGPTLYTKLLFALFGLLSALVVRGQDTINKYDENGKKHGWWVVTQKSNHPLIGTDTLEKGWYTHGKKEGIHLLFQPENICSSAYEYSSGFKHGKYVLYDAYGCILQHGNIVKEVLSGLNVSRSNCNGDFTIKYYDEYGRLNGDAYTYEEWGALKTFYHWENGKKTYGAHFDSTGKITYRTGTMHDSLVPPDSVMKTDPDKFFDDSYLKTQMKPLMRNCYGTHIYKSVFKKSPDKQLTEEGDFRDGKLWNGKKYVYDKDGLLLKIEIYKEGKYAGDAGID